MCLYQGTLSPERTQPQNLCTAKKISGTIETHKNGPIRLKQKKIEEDFLRKGQKYIL